MRFVVIDLIPALLSWEGRDSSEPPEAQPGALDLVHDLFTDFRLAAVADGSLPATAVRETLERLELAPFFESVGTSSVFGPTVTPRVVRRITAAFGGAGNSILVTGRPSLAEAVNRSGIPAVGTEAGLKAVPAVVRKMAYGRVTR